MKIAKVTWRDSQMYLTQVERESEFTVATIISYGEVIEKTKTQIVIAGDVIDNEVRRVIAIPMENVSSVEYLE